jgi:hypothetical protein
MLLDTVFSIQQAMVIITTFSSSLIDTPFSSTCSKMWNLSERGFGGMCTVLCTEALWPNHYWLLRMKIHLIIPPVDTLSVPNLSEQPSQQLPAKSQSHFLWLVLLHCKATTREEERHIG